MPLIKDSGSLIYKCRMCGQQFSAFHVPSVMLASMSLIADVNYKADDNGPSVNKTTLHNCCANGLRIGVADFVGSVFDVDDEIES